PPVAGISPLAALVPPQAAAPLRPTAAPLAVRVPRPEAAAAPQVAPVSANAAATPPPASAAPAARASLPAAAASATLPAAPAGWAIPAKATAAKATSARPRWSFLSSGFVRAAARAGTVVATVTVLAVLTRLAPDSAIVGPANNAQSTGAVSGLGTPLPTLAVALGSPSAPTPAGTSLAPVHTEPLLSPPHHPATPVAPA